MRPLNRVDPQAPAAGYKTYQVASPDNGGGWWVDAGCAEVDCPQRANGWVTVVDESTELGQQQAGWIRANCRPVDRPAAGRAVRRYREERTPAGWTAFTFAAGQECFARHTRRTARPEIYVVRGGDWRGNPTGDQRRHTRPEDWVEDFSEHQDRIATRRARG